MMYDTTYPSSASQSGRGQPTPQLSENLDRDPVPRSLEDMDQNSLQDNLANNVGYYVEIDFLVGSDTLVSRDGILYAVGTDYVTLYQEADDRYIVCDLYSIQFVTFYNSRVTPQSRMGDALPDNGGGLFGRNRNLG